MFLHQAAYCKRVMERFEVIWAKPAPTTMVENFNDLYLDGFAEEMDKICNKMLLRMLLMGALHFLACELAQPLLFRLIS